MGRNAASPLRRGGARGAGWRTTSPTMHASARSPDWLRRSNSVTSGRGGAVAAGWAGWVSRSWGPAAAMNFSEVFKLSSLLCKFSPDGKYLVSGRGAWAEGGPSAGRRLSSPGGGDPWSGERGGRWARMEGARGSAGVGPGQVLQTGDPGKGTWEDAAAWEPRKPPDACTWVSIC